MNKLEKILWRIKVWKHARVVAFWVLMGRKDKSDREYRKVLKMLDAYQDAYL